MHGDGLADDEAIADEFADGLAGVCVGDLADLVGVEPDLALTASDDGRGKALLSSEVDPIVKQDMLARAQPHVHAHMCMCISTRI